MPLLLLLYSLGTLELTELSLAQVTQGTGLKSGTGVQRFSLLSSYTSYFTSPTSRFYFLLQVFTVEAFGRVWVRSWRLAGIRRTTAVERRRVEWFFLRS